MESAHLKMLTIYGLSCRIQRLALSEDREAREQLWIAAARNSEASYEDLGLDYEGVTHAALYDDVARESRARSSGLHPNRRCSLSWQTS